MVRYADDFVLGFTNKQDAERVMKVLPKRFGKYGLEPHLGKTKLIDLTNKRIEGKCSFDFLGFTHYVTNSRTVCFKVGRKTSKKKFGQKCKEMNQWLKSVRNLVKTKEWWQTLKKKLNGHYGYYGVSDNIRHITKYYHKTIRMLYKWLCRRSQKRRLISEKFNNYLKCYPLPKPRIKHNFYTLSHAK